MPLAREAPFDTYRSAIPGYMEVAKFCVELRGLFTPRLTCSVDGHRRRWPRSPHRYTLSKYSQYTVCGMTLRCIMQPDGVAVNQFAGIKGIKIFNAVRLIGHQRHFGGSHLP